MNPGAWVHREPRMNPACATGFAMNSAHVIGLAMNPARTWVRDIPRRKLGSQSLPSREPRRELGSQSLPKKGKHVFLKQTALDIQQQKTQEQQKFQEIEN
ncbi:hypothetical protein SLEP1_g43850 [Rubroshorea leprosula]|uniref:Uncharacterized protein n=1 Tax=Rubroshorea leprosula TaxID=152421 RepID=A0AAV5LFD0_9ROSI|nr:hypothetical protein SLEP1_g43850 [Rubroshorea leprosula]